MKNQANLKLHKFLIGNLCSSTGIIMELLYKLLVSFLTDPLISRFRAGKKAFFPVPVVFGSGIWVRVAIRDFMCHFGYYVSV